VFPTSTVILVVDDSSVIRESVRKELLGIGYSSVIEADDGKKALALLEGASATSSPVTLVISDWNMPNMNGLEFLKVVRRTPKWLNLPFIMLTSASQISEVVDAISAGVSTYVVKPLDGKTLKEKLAGAWAKHNPK
jgi:two-component system, chemotaxis family, chemotaxis protein CheY